MNVRRISWLPGTVLLLVCSQTLLAQLPEAASNAANAVQQPNTTKPTDGTFFYSDMPAPETTAPAQQPIAPTPDDFPLETTTPKTNNSPAAARAEPFQTTPVRPASTQVYSDIGTSEKPRGTTVQQPRKVVPRRPTNSLFYSDINKPTNTAQQAAAPTPVPTVEHPAGAYSNHDLTGSRLWTGTQLKRPTTFTDFVNQDPSTSPSDVSQSPKQSPKQKGKFCRTLNLWGEFLYLRPRNAEITYAVETNSAVSPPVPPVQVGRIGMVDQTHEPGFRAGLTYTLDETSSLSASWAMLETHRTDRIDRTNIINAIESMSIHPTSPAASSSGTFATGSHDIDFDLVDIEYRGLLDATDLSEMNYVIGVRYVYLQQEFFTSTDILGNQTVSTDIDFNGVGVRLGLEGERFRHKSRCFFYGKTYANFIAGESNAKFDQGQTFDASVVDTLWEAGRIISMYELELGLGHVSKSGCLSWNVGYSFSAWTNVVQTDEFINAVQTNNFLDLGDLLTFDGLVCRLEGRY